MQKATFVCIGEFNKSNVTQFNAYIDDDGDFAVQVNGELLFYVDHANGHLVRLTTDPDEHPTLVFDDTDKIFVE